MLTVSNSGYAILFEVKNEIYKIIEMLWYHLG